nr:MAG TPA: hypothetical protein [Caudoviricetes sp.]DAU40189.1 MAG TPA: hypothetical protein [Caudoviricetes sp.]
MNFPIYKTIAKVYYATVTLPPEWRSNMQRTNSRVSSGTLHIEVYI